MRFCGLFVLPCLAVLVPGVAFGTLLSAAAAAASTAAAVYFPQVFNSNRVSEVTLGFFWCDSVAYSSFGALLFWRREAAAAAAAA